MLNQANPGKQTAADTRAGAVRGVRSLQPDRLLPRADGDAADLSSRSDRLQGLTPDEVKEHMNCSLIGEVSIPETFRP